MRNSILLIMMLKFLSPQFPAKFTSNRKEESLKDKAITQVRPAVIDDFIRKFLIKIGMSKTLDVFNTEWQVEWQYKKIRRKRDGLGSSAFRSAQISGRMWFIFG